MNISNKPCQAFEFLEQHTARQVICESPSSKSYSNMTSFFRFVDKRATFLIPTCAGECD